MVRVYGELPGVAKSIDPLVRLDRHFAVGLQAIGVANRPEFSRSQILVQVLAEATERLEDVQNLGEVEAFLGRNSGLGLGTRG